METIGNQKLWSFLDGSEKAEVSSNTKVRADRGHYVESYLELARKIAALQFRNLDYVFLFRGQARDYRNLKRSTTLRPSILRSRKEPKSTVQLKYERLHRAERLLIDRYNLTALDRIKKHRLVRWAILQHYEVCETPLLDVSQSIRIAASFASIDHTTEAFLYVLGVPNISGAITASAEAGLTILRLSSVCPSEAVRPHIQEGYLLSEYPELSSPEQKEHYENYEVDFGLRLIAKFRFNPIVFWGSSSEFPRVHRQALYPTWRRDPLLEIADSIRETLSNNGP